ncbi:hypothetical protein MMC13_000972 [Lambiella insularis]|nr:hypothetical protein [Lambiella insularis]
MARLVGVKVGDKVVVFGAGTVGLLCAAVARAFGAEKVICVDIVDRRLTYAKGYAATGTFKPDPVISPKRNAEWLIKEQELGVGADVVMEASGAEPSIQTGVHVLRKGGSYVQGGMGKRTIDFPIATMVEKELKMSGCFRYGSGDYDVAMSLLRAGRLSVKELITGVMDFAQATDAWEQTRRGEGIKTLIKVQEI